MIAETPHKEAAHDIVVARFVFGGCGSAIFAAKQIAQAEVGTDTYQLGIGFLGVSLAFGLTVVTMAYAVGHISGAHFNPATSLGAAVSGRLPWRDLPEVLLTAFFLIAVLGATDDRAPKGFGPLAIGLALALINLASIRSVTARSIQPGPPASPSSIGTAHPANCGCSGWHH